ncbi:MAG: histidine phosphatase family protein [Chloroflexi bacterium]|nr:histidine phosphatase family protein [Chloroflexota bacterium]
MRLILVRHGETPWNEARRVQGGRSDIGLGERGLAQVERLAVALAGENIQAVYSSPLKRALATARAIARPHGLEVRPLSSLREIDAGQAEGLPVDRLKEDFAPFWKEWREGDGPITWPGGESVEQVARRAWGAIARLRRRHPGETVVVVGHAFVITSILVRALGLPPGHFRRLRVEAGSVSVLELNQKGPLHNRLLLLNHTCPIREDGHR